MELAEPFAMSQPAISKHLKVLERAGLISRSRDAQRRPRRLEAKPLAEATKWLERYRRYWEGNYQRLDALLEKARDLVVRGRGGTLLEYRDYFPGQHMAMTARSFISFNGREDESNAYSIKFAPQIKVPALVIHGTADEIALAPNPKNIYESLGAAPHRDLVWVDGAGHFVTAGHFAQTYAEKIVDWLVTNMPPR